MLKRILLGAAPLALAAFVTAASAQDDGRGVVADATTQSRAMQDDPNLRAMLARARGVLLIPQYGQGAFIVGGRGGEGVLLVHQPSGRWSNPLFYSLGGASIGFQAGGNVGQVAYIIMSPTALRQFLSGNSFRLGAGVGLNVANYRTGERINLAGDDVVVWSNTQGLYGGVGVGATDVQYDGRLTGNYYGEPGIGTHDVVRGQVQSRNADRLKDSLPSSAP